MFKSETLQCFVCAQKYKQKVVDMWNFVNQKNNKKICFIESTYAFFPVQW